MFLFHTFVCLTSQFCLYVKCYCPVWLVARKLEQICSQDPIMKLLVFLFQKRTKEKLVHVLSLCGQEVGLSKNPSVSSVMYHSYFRVMSPFSLVCFCLWSYNLEDSTVNDKYDSHCLEQTPGLFLPTPWFLITLSSETMKDLIGCSLVCLWILLLFIFLISWIF